ncbi:peptidoglycan-binding protein [Streptomyces ficellus]|uniref:Peptidoglycan-binding protein n=1 Tax=Streptomyces ficellus TaxID=1977088 RepID=A0ABT7Z2M7_9ACTN|nr:peptidoglycan-binding protein [Streptomyces ficellus]MDN3293739.1 peptidoglycan-binding protein [Streptomyces ficellus]
MAVPVFEEYEPAADCPCAGCARQRRELALGLAVRAGGHPAAHGARRALVLFTAAGVVLGGGGVGDGGAVALAQPGRPSGETGAARVKDDPDAPTPQGSAGPLHGGGRPHAGPTSQDTAPVLRKSTRAEIINRARRWVAEKVPYSMERYWTDGYRQDCSGFVSMAWNLTGNEWTGTLGRFGTRIDRSELQPGDILLFHNPADPNRGSHVTIFGGWTDYTRTTYIAYEQARPHARRQVTPMAYWNNSSRYVAYRYKGLTSGDPGNPGAPGVSVAYPGPVFGLGAANGHVTRLGRMLVERGGARFYRSGPGPRWGEADRRATRAFQRAQGWTGREADGLPGPHTWRLLVNGQGRDITSAASAPAFPGRGHFRPGQSNKHVERLGRRLVQRGFGAHYRWGPGPRWTEADRRNVEAFQRAQGWRGGAANGYPGPETWRRLFR